MKGGFLYYQLSAFADRPFEGNPAGVCLLPDWLSDRGMKRLTAETGMPVVAFLVAGEGRFDMRWFTAVTEEEMCGHGTLAAAWVVINDLAPGADRVTFATPAGEISVRRDGAAFEMDLPARPPHPIAPKPAIAAAIGLEPEEYLLSSYNIAVLRCGEEVADLRPDLGLVAKLDPPGLIVTAKGEGFGCDIVTRYFAPAKGIPEDAATGSAHAQIMPYWSRRLEKKELLARQLSARGGSMLCRDLGSHIRIVASVSAFMTGRIMADTTADDR